MAVHVVGNVGLDTTFRLARFPKPGETLNAETATVALGGKGANQALAALRAGAETTLWSAVGEDADADAVRRGLAAEGLSLRGLTTLPLPTDRSSILVDGSGENQIVSAVACARAFDPATSGWRGVGRSGDVLLLQGNLAPETTRAALEAGRALGLRTILNASPLGDGVDMPLSSASVLVVNRVEGEMLTGERDARRIVTALCRLGGGAAVVTLGGEGFAFAERADDEPRHGESEAVRAVDTSGAGDVFCGTFAARLSLGDGFEPALRLAGRAAAVAVTRHGTFGCGPSRGEIQNWQEREPA